MHPEKIPSVIDRYVKETRRILSVLEGVLSDRDYLVGGKVTVADTVWVPYNDALQWRVLGEQFEFEKEYPNVYKYVHCHLYGSVH